MSNELSYKLTSHEKAIDSDQKLESYTIRSDKPLLKLTQTNNNTKSAEYVTLEDDNGPKTDFPEQKTIAFWTLVCLLFILAIGNLILTFIILGVLRLGQGMESLEIVPDSSLLKFYKNTDLDQLYKRDGKLEGFSDIPMEITGNMAPIKLDLVDKNSRPKNKLRIDRNGTLTRYIRQFQIIDPITGEKIFSTDNPRLTINKTISNLHTRIVNTNRVTSSTSDSLHLRAGARAHLRGNEGTNMGSREIVWSADQDIYLKTDNGSIVLSGKEGIYIDVKKIPIASGIPLSKSIGQYKLCVCMPRGKLFRVPVYNEHGRPRVSCSDVDLSSRQNFCL